MQQSPSLPCFIKRKHQSIFLWEAAKAEHAGGYLCKKSQDEPSSPSCAQKETPCSSLLPSSCTGPLACPSASCSPPTTLLQQLLQPTRNPPPPSSGCMLVGVLGHCIPHSPFWTPWLLPHWPKSLQSAMVHSEEDSWGQWLSPLCRGLCTTHLLLQGSNQSSSIT